MDDQLSADSFFLVGKSIFLCVPVFMLDGTLRNVFGSLWDVFGQLRILSDPTKNLGTLKIKMSHLYKCKKVGRYRMVVSKVKTLKTKTYKMKTPFKYKDPLET